MTVHSRRYGRWCREHFDTPAPAGDKAVKEAQVPPPGPAEPTGPPAPPSPRKPKG